MVSSQHPVRQRKRSGLSGLGPQSHRIEHFRVRWEGPRDRARGRARQDLLADLQGALAQGLGLPVPPALSVEDGQVVEGGSHLWGPGRRVRSRKAQPRPSLPPGPHSPRGARGPVSAPGSAGRRGAGLWLPCTCSGPCGAAQGWWGQPGWVSRGQAGPGTGAPFVGPFWVSPHLLGLAPPEHCPASGHPRNRPHSVGVSVTHTHQLLFAWVHAASADLSPSHRHSSTPADTRVPASTQQWLPPLRPLRHSGRGLTGTPAPGC